VNAVLDDHHDDDVDGPFDEQDEFDDFDDFGDDLDDEAFADDEHAEPSPIRRFERSAVGTVFSASMLGLRDALEGPKKEEVQVVTDWAGDPPFKDPYVLRLDPDHPEDSIVMVRPWLRDASDAGDGGDAHNLREQRD
jgi:hypothetical protein